MSSVPRTAALQSANTAPAARWVLLALQIPATPSNARVKTWRRLQQLGAVPVKHAVYALPYSMQAVEDFTWLQKEVEGRGGQATVFGASSVEAVGDRGIVEQFQTVRATDYKQLLADVRRVVQRAGKHPATIPPRDVRTLRGELERIRSVDFFSAPGRAEADDALAALEARLRQPVDRTERARTAQILDRSEFARRTWITRPRPGVNRFASAWLIQRFIDQEARFAFADSVAQNDRAIPYDMYDSRGFGHDGDRCTFEVLQGRFGIDDRIVSRIGEIVHDVDLKDDRYHAPQAATIDLLVEGLRASIADDAELLKHGMTVFDALYHGLAGQTIAPARKPRKARVR